MLNFSQLTQDQFARPETLQAVKAEAFDLVDHLMVPESKKLAIQLEDRLKSLPGLATQVPEIYYQYQKIIIFLKITALMALDNNVVLELVQKNYLDSLEAGLDFNERMTGKMYSLPDLIWPEYAEQLAYALKQNIQKIGQKPIVISGETEQKPPTIQNWLSDFDRVLGPDLHTNIQQEEYLSKNPNAKTLDEKEKNKLRNVLKFYNNLKPIPATIINQTLKETGIFEELPGEQTFIEQTSRPYIVTEPTIIQAPKRYARPGEIKDQYLEPIGDDSEAIKQTPQKPKPTPFIPPSTAPKIQQPAYTQPISSRPPSQFSQPTRPQEFSSSPQTRGGAPPLVEQRGAEIPSTPPPAPSTLYREKSANAASEEGRAGVIPMPQYSPAQPTPPVSRSTSSFSQPPPLSRPQAPPSIPPSSPAPRPISTPAPLPQPARQNSYLEPIDVPEITTKPAPPPKKPTPSPIVPLTPNPTPKKSEPDPRLQGNIIDLKGNVKNV